MKKVIVTGGLGFIGSNLIDLLISKNYHVINIDKITYSSNFYNTREHRNSRKYKFIKCDIKEKKIKKILFNHKPIAIFNLAAETHVDRSIDNPESFIQSNIVGVYNLLESFKEFSKYYMARFARKLGSGFVLYLRNYGKPKGSAVFTSVYSTSRTYAFIKYGALSWSWYESFASGTTVSC